MAPNLTINKINRAGAVVIPPSLREQYGFNAGDEIAFEPQQGALVMKPVKKRATVNKISRKDLRETPEWLKTTHERAKNSPLGRMTEKEIGQLCEELAERGAQRRLAQQT